MYPGKAVTDRKYCGLAADDCWRRYFAKDPQVLGRTIFLSDIGFTIVGVAPPAFTEVFQVTPAGWSLPQVGLKGPLFFVPWYNPPPIAPVSLFGRLKAGISRSESQADLSRISSQLSAVKGRYVSISVVPGNTLEPNLWTALALLMSLFVAGLAIVLMIACDNAIILLARIAARRREVGIRLALGATRSQLIRLNNHCHAIVVECFRRVLRGVIVGVAINGGVADHHRVTDGQWKIAQYNLAITIPNDRFADVKGVRVCGSLIGVYLSQTIFKSSSTSWNSGSPV
jgi:hypothetical protein